LKGNGNGSGTGSVDDAGSIAQVEGKIVELKILYAKAGDAEFEFALGRAAKQFDLPKSKLRKWVVDGGETEREGLALAPPAACRRSCR
jgi:hypothetical protein